MKNNHLSHACYSYFFCCSASCFTLTSINDFLDRTWWSPVTRVFTSPPADICILYTACNLEAQHYFLQLFFARSFIFIEYKNPHAFALSARRRVLRYKNKEEVPIFLRAQLIVKASIEYALAREGRLKPAFYYLNRVVSSL